LSVLYNGFFISICGIFCHRLVYFLIEPHLRNDYTKSYFPSYNLADLIAQFIAYPIATIQRHQMQHPKDNLITSVKYISRNGVIAFYSGIPYSMIRYILFSSGQLIGFALVRRIYYFFSNQQK